VSPQRLDQCSPPGQRLDVRSDLTAGFPYRLAHASAVAELLALLLRSPTPKKGLITDLDETLWAGILGEVGHEGISWDLDRHSHGHALYQQMLNALAEAGVLLAVASKNDPRAVERAFEREDLLLAQERVFPREVHWQPKSESVARILEAWNVGAVSVVFVDDSPLELAEVQAAIPALECIPFRGQDEQAVYQLLERLRDLFGKDALTEEDALRGESLRRSDEMRQDAARAGLPEGAFLQTVAAEMTLSFQKTPPDPRAFELVNKTNQFNLNGRRPAERAWLSYLRRPETVLLSASYKDKYGPLGKIAVLAGRLQGKQLLLDTWVTSCRAFGRGVEHRCLQALFDQLGLEEVVFDFAVTPRNGPLQEFLRCLLEGPAFTGARLQRAQFVGRCPMLFHSVKVLADE